MSWTLLTSLVLGLGIALIALWTRRHELERVRERVGRRDLAVRQGSHAALLQHPVVDLSRCLGCATCVAACPEDGVLEIVHGQALVVRGARCQGISACERECPVGAITVTLDKLDERDDVPALTETLEAVGTPGLFLAGEVTAHALIKTAIEHGVLVAAEVARRQRIDGPPSLIASERRSLQAVGTEGRALRTASQDPATNSDAVLDLCIVGAGPAGLACALEAKRSGLSFVTLEREERPGGTVAKYPRKKLVMTQPVDLPMYGRFGRTTYTKEELVELWHGIAEEQELPIEGGQVFRGLERDANGAFVVRTDSGRWTARNVCLALGRRGVPTRLDVPGEDLAKVAYGLTDAGSFEHRRILVVGGGDSAIEAALGLADQVGNRVTISYRREAFFRLRARNEERLAAALAAGRVAVVFHSQVRMIGPDTVELLVSEGTETRSVSLPNDEVFILAGGVAPLDLLRAAGVSFDPALRPAGPDLSERGTGLMRGLAVGFVLSTVALAFALWNLDYYGLERVERAAHPDHNLLRPGLGWGLVFGLASIVLILANLSYLVRRSAGPRLAFGSLTAWMTSHVGTGILAFLFAALHSAMRPADTAGGHAFWVLFALIVTGSVGRYFYACVPRAANGRELELSEVKTKLGRLSDEWDQGQQRFRDLARREVQAMIELRQWKRSFLGRILGLFGSRRDLRRLLARLSRLGEREGVAEEQVDETLELARRAHGLASVAAHYEDLRALLNGWRYLHRWGAALLVLLIFVHVLAALSYGAFSFGGVS